MNLLEIILETAFIFLFGVLTSCAMSLFVFDDFSNKKAVVIAIGVLSALFYCSAVTVWIIFG